MKDSHIDTFSESRVGLERPVRHLSETEPATHMTISRMRAGESLVRACMAGDGLRARMLLELGVRPNVNDPALGYTPLMAACLGGHVEIAKDLLFYGASPNMADAYGRTALTAAAAGGHADLVQLLLDAGASHTVPELDDNHALNAA
ncbi:MAG: ankyrin repeat domain-containing protein [Thermodesulfobacteriota bacterium]